MQAFNQMQIVQPKLLCRFSMIFSSTSSYSPRSTFLTVCHLPNKQHRSYSSSTTTSSAIVSTRRSRYWFWFTSIENKYLSRYSALSFKSNSDSEDIAIDPSHSYAKSYKLDGYGEGSIVKITTNTRHTIKTDLPKYMGGKDTAPQPVETLLAAWMGCTQATAMFVGRQIFSSSSDDNKHNPRSKQNKTRIRIERLEFDDIVAVRDERGALQLPIEKSPEIPSRIQRISGTIRVVTSSKASSSQNVDEKNSNNNVILTREEMCLLKEQTEQRCPIANMILLSGCSIDVDWIQGVN